MSAGQEKAELPSLQTVEMDLSGVAGQSYETLGNATRMYSVSALGMGIPAFKDLMDYAEGNRTKTREQLAEDLYHFYRNMFLEANFVGIPGGTEGADVLLSTIERTFELAPKAQVALPERAQEILNAKKLSELSVDFPPDEQGDQIISKLMVMSTGLINSLRYKNMGDEAVKAKIKASMQGISMQFQGQFTRDMKNGQANNFKILDKRSGSKGKKTLGELVQAKSGSEEATFDHYMQVFKDLGMTKSQIEVLVSNMTQQSLLNITSGLYKTAHGSKQNDKGMFGRSEKSDIALTVGDNGAEELTYDTVATDMPVNEVQSKEYQRVMNFEKKDFARVKATLKFKAPTKEELAARKSIKLEDMVIGRGQAKSLVVTQEALTSEATIAQLPDMIPCKVSKGEVVVPRTGLLSGLWKKLFGKKVIGAGQETSSWKGRDEVTQTASAETPKEEKQTGLFNWLKRALGFGSNKVTPVEDRITPVKVLQDHSERQFKEQGAMEAKKLAKQQQKKEEAARRKANIASQMGNREAPTNMEEVEEAVLDNQKEAIKAEALKCTLKQLVKKEGKKFLTFDYKGFRLLLGENKGDIQKGIDKKVLNTALKDKGIKHFTVKTKAEKDGQSKRRVYVKVGDMKQARKIVETAKAQKIERRVRSTLRDSTPGSTGHRKTSSLNGKGKGAGR